MHYRMQTFIASLLFASSAWSQYSTPVRIVEQPVETTESKEVINLVEQDVLTSGAVTTLPFELITVPPDRRLVITSAAVDTGLSSCAFTLNPRIRISRTISPSLVMFPLGRVTASAYGTSPTRYVNQATFPVTVYADEGDTVRFDLFRSATNCVTIVRFSITGYLEENF